MFRISLQWQKQWKVSSVIRDKWNLYPNLSNLPMNSPPSNSKVAWYIGFIWCNASKFSNFTGWNLIVTCWIYRIFNMVKQTYIDRKMISIAFRQYFRCAFLNDVHGRNRWIIGALFEIIWNYCHLNKNMNALIKVYKRYKRLQ